MLQKCFLRSCSEEGSDAAELSVSDQNWFQIATTVQQQDSLFNSSTWVLQVHIRTSPDASPENVGVFVGSDPTDSVTAPCKCEKIRTKEVLHLFRCYTIYIYTHIYIYTYIYIHHELGSTHKVDGLTWQSLGLNLGWALQSSTSRYFKIASLKNC